MLNQPSCSLTAGVQLDSSRWLRVNTMYLPIQDFGVRTDRVGECLPYNVQTMLSPDYKEFLRFAQEATLAHFSGREICEC